MAERLNDLAQEGGRAQSFHQAPFTVPRVTPPFAAAIERLKLIGRRRAMSAVFGGRVTRQAIIHWRKGRRAVPRWALQMVHRELKREAESFLHHAAMIAAEIERANPSRSNSAPIE